MNDLVMSFSACQNDRPSLVLFQSLSLSLSLQVVVRQITNNIPYCGDRDRPENEDEEDEDGDGDRESDEEDEGDDCNVRDEFVVVFLDLRRPLMSASSSSFPDEE